MRMIMMVLKLSVKVENDSDVYAKYQNESRLLSEFYSKEHVLNMWREFYLSAYKDKQEELLNKKNRVFMKNRSTH